MDLLSPSRINTYLRCPRIYYYRYILAIPERKNIALYKGSTVHALIKELFLREKYTVLQNFVKRRLPEIWNPEKEGVFIVNKDELSRHYKETQQILLMFVRRLKDKLRLMKFDKKVNTLKEAYYLIKPMFMEERIVDEQLGVQGIIDSIERNFEKKLFIIDYKTSKLYKRTVPQEYIRQLMIYALLYYRKTNVMPDYVGINYLRYGETFYFPVTEKDLEETYKLIYDIKEKTKSTNIVDYPISDNVPDFVWDDIEYYQKYVTEHPDILEKIKKG